ncbi:hypothetical protein JHK87_009896 [Glycine soja]|nr:hypothetical protein JHK87_009896 [Glycine soja]
MVVNIVKLLRDSDFVVRDVSVNTVALLTSKLGREGDKKEKVFVLLVMPIFEALDKQNKHTLSGFALCLARIDDKEKQLLLEKAIKTLKYVNNLLSSYSFCFNVVFFGKH